MGVAVFSYSKWAQTFAVLNQTPEPVAAIWFDVAEFYLNNTASSVVTDVDKRLTMLNLITAHLVKVFVGDNNGPASGIVGTITDAAQGTVHLSAKLEGDNQARAFWSQTPYGLAYWQMALAYMTAHYRAVPQPGQWPWAGPTI